LRYEGDAPPNQSERFRQNLEPWLSAILQSEHLSLLVGNGLTIAATNLTGASSPSMSTEISLSDIDLDVLFRAEVALSAERIGRGAPNIEDYLRVAMTLEAGLRIAGDARADFVNEAIESALSNLVTSILTAERSIRSGEDPVDDFESDSELTPVGYLVSLLLTFSSRTPNRDRLHVFTTNYDRVVEFTCESAGIRIIDRFVGTLRPRFRASRMDIDLHYNPAGVLGEPRFLEGVIRVSKLHGSVDWQVDEFGVVRIPVAFGSTDEPDSKSALIYPSAAKDQETSYYPALSLLMDTASEMTISTGYWPT